MQTLTWSKYVLILNTEPQVVFGITRSTSSHLISLKITLSKTPLKFVRAEFLQGFWAVPLHFHAQVGPHSMPNVVDITY